MVLNIIHTDATESLPLFSTQMLPYIFFLAVVPIILISMIKIKYKNKIKHILTSIVTIILAFIIALSITYISFKELHRAANLSNKYILYSLVPVNYLAAIIDVAKKTIIPMLNFDAIPDKNITATIIKKDDLVVVLAIGEAVRQKNLSLYGYARVNTTPLLSKIKNLYTLNGNARLGSTLYALKEILRKDDIKLTHITNTAGIKTNCYVNYTMYDNCSVGEIKAIAVRYNNSYDEDVIPLMEKNLNGYKNGYNFIVLHLGGGAHGPIYSHRHPKKYNILNPICNNPDMLNVCTKEERYNSYDNAMLYQDYVVSQIISKLDNSKVPYIFIYVSDHGESLGEDGYVFHGMPPGMQLPPEQANIALLVKASMPIEIIKKSAYTQPDIFDTILSLFNIKIKDFNKNGNFINKQ
ncbi:membrane protein [hydrothermal vent metagenome]|uniref:Membrane protein n=1 Tax=hydrothermal vent metagenome TaxID=652676 RepID=A0A3B1DSE2_9ZZZZ